MPEHETPRQTAERELLAVREEVRRMAESIRARLPVDQHIQHERHDQHDTQQHTQKQHTQDKQDAGPWES